MENQERFNALNEIGENEVNTHLVLSPGASKKAVVPYDSFHRYMHEIRRYGLLSREEEMELARRYKEEQDVEAGHRLVTANLRLVVKIAMGFYRFWSQQVLDLIQEGNLGLVHALQKFDPYRGVKFSSYAAFWIRAYMLKFLMDNWRLVKIGTTQGQRKLFFRLSKERERLESQGIEAEPKLLAERLDVKEEEVIDMTERMASPEAPLDEPRGEDGRETYGQSLPAPEAELDERIFETERREAFLKMLKEYRSALTGRKAFIFDQRIIREHPLTLQEIGRKFDISRERVRQIESLILSDIRKEVMRELPQYAKELVNP
jgi:RNA polymerase sigma-32 factor